MKKILIVEDESAYLKLLGNLLIKEGFEITLAKDGQDGLAKALTWKPDLILLDIRMPVMDGIAMLEKLRQDQYGKDAKVILLTNLESDEKTLTNILKDQPVFYQIKSDIKLSELLTKIKKII